MFILGYAGTGNKDRLYL